MGADSGVAIIGEFYATLLMLRIRCNKIVQHYHIFNDFIEGCLRAPSKSIYCPLNPMTRCKINGRVLWNPTHPIECPTYPIAVLSMILSY